MNSNRCSKLLTLLLAATLVVSAVGPAAAMSASASGAPSEAKVGEDVKTTFTVEKPFSDYEQWTLNGQTDLTGVTWTVKLYDQAGDKVSQKSYDGQSFNHSLKKSNAFEVKVVLEGTVAEVEDFTYDPAQKHLLAELNQVRKGGSSSTIDTWQFRPYTDESQQARQAIDDARSTIEDAKASGASVSGAESSLEDAISAYDGENFELASDLAGKAKESANSAQKSSQQTQMLVYGGAGLLALVVVVGGIFWYRSQQDDYDKLR